MEETLGTIIFQDQVIEVAQAFCGFSPGEAESLRRAMSRKRSEAAIEAHHDGFVKRAQENFDDVTPQVAEEVWQMVKGFAGFGFPKAHGAAFGLLAYHSRFEGCEMGGASAMPVPDDLGVSEAKAEGGIEVDDRRIRGCRTQEARRTPSEVNARRTPS